MKLGISSFSYTWAVGIEGHMPDNPLSFMDLINLTHGFELSLLQIGDNLPLHKLSQDELNEGKQALEKYGIDLEIGCRGLLDETLEKYLKLCVFFSSKLLRIVIDVGKYEPSDEEIIGILRKWMPEFEKNNVVLAIENHDRFKAHQLVSILKAVDSDYVGICLDTANSLGCLEGVETITESLIPYTVNLHAKDIQIHRLASQLGFQVTGSASCEGMLNIKALLQQVYLKNSKVNCILEQWTEFTGNLEETIRIEAEEAHRGVQNLKEYIEEVVAANGTLTRLEVLEKYDTCIVEKAIINGKESCRLVILEQYEESLLQNDMKDACSKYPVTQICLGNLVEKKLFERDSLRNGRIEHLICLLKKMNYVNCIVFSTGDKKPLLKNNTLKDIHELEMDYFNNLAFLAAACKREGMCVGFYVTKGGFVDDITIFLHKLNHYSEGDYKIYI